MKASLVFFQKKISNLNKICQFKIKQDIDLIKRFRIVSQLKLISAQNVTAFLHLHIQLLCSSIYSASKPAALLVLVQEVFPINPLPSEFTKTLQHCMNKCSHIFGSPYEEID